MHISLSSLRTALAVVALLALGLVNAHSDPPGGQANVVFPLKIGNEWIGMTNSIYGQHFLDTMRITGDTVIDRERWFTLGGSEWIMQFGRYNLRTGESLITNRADGLYIRNRQKPGTAFRLIHYPARMGDTIEDISGHWRVMGDKFGSNDITVISLVASTDSVVKVPAGSYHCVVARYRSTRLDGRKGPDTFRDNFTCYAPGVGKIKSADSRADRQGKPVTEVTWELVRAKLR